MAVLDDTKAILERLAKGDVLRLSTVRKTGDAILFGVSVCDRDARLVRRGTVKRLARLGLIAVEHESSWHTDYRKAR